MPLTNFRLCDNIDYARCNEIDRARFYFSPAFHTIIIQIVGNQARDYHGGNVNHFGCALSVASGNDNQRDGAGLITFSPANRAALTGVVSTGQSLATRKEQAFQMDTQNSTIPQDASTNSPEHICSKAPSHTDQEFVESILGRTPPEARARLAARTREALRLANAYPDSGLKSRAAFTAEDLRDDITQAIRHIDDFDDLAALVSVALRFTCLSEARAWRGEAA